MREEGRGEESALTDILRSFLLLLFVCLFLITVVSTLAVF